MEGDLSIVVITSRGKAHPNQGLFDTQQLIQRQLISLIRFEGDIFSDKRGYRKETQKSFHFHGDFESTRMTEIIELRRYSNYGDNQITEIRLQLIEYRTFASQPFKRASSRYA